MVVIEHTYDFERLTPEKIDACERRIAERIGRTIQPDAPMCSLASSLQAIKLRQGQAGENYVCLETYLVDNGLKARALEMIENQLKIPVASQALLELTLRSKFMQFDPTGTDGFIDLSDFGRLLANLLGEKVSLDAQANRIQVELDGKIRYDNFIAFWLQGEAT